MASHQPSCGIDQLRLGKRHGVRHSGFEAGPADLRRHGLIEILAGSARLDHCPAGDHKDVQVALNLAHGARGALVGFASGGTPERGHELLEHEQGRVSQSLLEPDGGGGQHGPPPKRVEAGQMLRRDPVRLVREPLENWQGQRTRPGAVDPERPDVLQPIDEPGHVLYGRRLRRVPEPPQPSELARGAGIQKPIEPAERGFVETRGQHLLGQAFRALARAPDHRFQNQRRR